MLYVAAVRKERWKDIGQTLRHSFSTYHVYVLETPIHILQDVKGHDKIETARKYISYDKEVRRRAMQETWE